MSRTRSGLASPQDTLHCDDCIVPVPNNSSTRPAAWFDDHSSWECWVVPSSLCPTCGGRK